MRLWILLALLLPRPGHATAPDDTGCARFAVSPREGATDRAAELRAALDEAAAFVGSEPDAFRRCPDLAGSLRDLAAGLIEVGEFSRATAACDLMGQGSPLRGEDLLLCARPALRGGRIAEARRLLSAFVAEAGPDPRARAEANLRVADVLEEASRYREAAEFLDAGPDGMALGHLVLRAIHNLLRAGEGDGARKTFERAIQRPDFAGDRGFLRDACLLFTRYGENDLARRAAGLLVVVPVLGETEVDAVVLAAAVASDPVLAERAARRLIGEAETPQARPGALRTAASMLERHGFVGAAARLLEDGLRDGTLSGTEDPIWLARLLIREGRTAEAHRVLDRLMETAQKTGPDWDRLADLWPDADRAGEAVAFLKRHETPADPGWVLALGRALHRIGRDEEEWALYEASANRFGRSDAYVFWRKVGADDRDRQDFARARDAFRQALRAATSDPQRAHAHLDIAETRLEEASGSDRTEKSREIESEVLAAMEVGGDDPSVRSRLDRVMERIGRAPMLSLALLEAAVRREPARSDLWRRLAFARLGARRPREAVEALRRFVETSPKPGEAVEEALSILLDANRSADAIFLLVHYESRLSVGPSGASVALSPGLARRVGMACAALGDRPCVSRHLGRFLDAPVQPEGDYLECARILTGFGLWTLAGRAVEKALQTLPPDLAWEAEFVAGEVALARGDRDLAEARFGKALAVAPQKREMVERVARAYEAAGRWAQAATWWERAVHDLTGAARLRAIGRLLESRMRQDDSAAARDAVKRMFPEPPEGPAAWTLMESLAAAGLTEEAVEVARAIWGRATGGPGPSPGPPQDDSLGPRTAWPWIARLFLRSGRTGEAREVARRVCAGAVEDSVCLAVSRVLSDRSLPKEALDALESRCRLRECGPTILVEVAGLRMRVGDRAAAVAAARQAAKRCEDADTVLGPLGPLFRNARAWKEYLDVIGVLRGRREFVGDPDLALETARALLATGDLGGALLLLSGYLGTGRGREAEVYRLLAAEGWRDEAARILLEAPASSLETLGVTDLRDIVLDLARTGRLDVTDRLLDRIRRSESERISLEPIARILADLGRDEEALAAFERIGMDRVSPEAGIEWVRLLWRSGNRQGALAVARAVAVPGPVSGESPDRPPLQPGSAVLDKEDVPSACRPLVAFFLDEEAVAEAWSLYQACPRHGEPAGELESRLAVAMVRSGDERFLAPARELFIEALSNVRAVHEDLVEFIRTEVARGRAADLIRELGAWGTSRTLLEARALTACLAGREEDVAGAIRDLAGAPGEPDPRGLLSAARALSECGRFREAHRMAMDGLRIASPSGPLASLARVAVRSGLAAGFVGTHRAVEGLLHSLIEDRGRLWGLIARVRRDGGDWAGSAEALFRRIAFVEDDRRDEACLQAFRAALMAGDRDLAIRVGELVLAGAKSRSEAVLSLANLSAKHLRDDLALRWLAAERTTWPGDPVVARTALEARLRTGSDDDVSEVVIAYVRALGDARSGWADTVALAATNLRLDLVREGLRHIEPGEAKDGVADAFLLAGIAFLRAGDDARGREAVIRGLTHARDPGEFLTHLAEAAIQDPSVPQDLVEEAIRAVGAGRPVEAGTLPLVRAARCLAGDAPSLCAPALALRGRTAILLAGFRKALLSGRYRVALDLVEAIQARDASRATALRTAATLVAAVWPPAEASRAPARELGLAVREHLARTGTRTLPGYPALEAHLADLVLGPGAGLAAYRSRLVIAPAEAEVRNNLAYYLSVGGLDLARALHEVRLAMALSSRGHAFYLETEAWAEFLRGETRRALVLQERARNLWRLDQGGGLAESFLHLGRIYGATGRAGGAREACRLAAVLEPLEASGVEALRCWRDLARSRETGID